MKNTLHRSVLASVAIALLLGAFGLVIHAQVTARANANTTTGNNSGGTGRQGDGQPLRVIVTLNGAPVAKAAIAVSVSDGSVILRGVTKPTGIFVTTSLDQGVYTVTAKTPKGTSTSPVTIIQSTDPAVVTLALAAK